MASIQYIQGNLFNALFQTELGRRIIVPHVCNSSRQWCAGFVLGISKNFAVAEKKYRNWRKWRGLKLGTTQFVEVAPSTVVANMIAQDNTESNNGIPLSYASLVKCMEDVAKYAVKNKMEIFCPKFGSGIACGSWPFIEQLIQEVWMARGINTTVFYL